MSQYPSKQLDQFVVRLPYGMRDRIKAAAEKNNRSMNAEIVATLRPHYPDPKAPDYEEFRLFLEQASEFEMRKFHSKLPKAVQEVIREHQRSNQERDD
jgi:hypothetical protein